jgi:SAM-dependent methyltransferase
VCQPGIIFDNAVAYEHFMGPWSLTIGKEFLDWLAPPSAARWLDVGCGSGAFTSLVQATCAPASIVAIDPAAEQIDYARSQPIASHATFHQADAQMLPFDDGTFDIVASALVMNFFPDRHRALREMRRVCRDSGQVAGFVWDSASGHAANWPVVHALRKIGQEPPPVPAFASGAALQMLFEQAGLGDIATSLIEVTVSFPDFDTYWRTNTPAFTPHGKIIAALSDIDRLKLIELVQSELPARRDGSVAYGARAIAIKSVVKPEAQGL